MAVRHSRVDAAVVAHLSLSQTLVSIILPRPYTVEDMPTVGIVIGMAGSGKTSLMQRINAYRHAMDKPPYIINLDPAVTNLPYDANVVGPCIFLDQRRHFLWDDLGVVSRHRGSGGGTAASATATSATVSGKATQTGSCAQVES